MPALTIKQRLDDIAGRLEGMAEDMATAADEGDVDPRAVDEVGEALTSVEKAIEYIK